MSGDFEREVTFGQQVQLTRPSDGKISTVVIVEEISSGSFGGLRVVAQGELMPAGSLDGDWITSFDNHCWTLPEIEMGMREAGMDPLFIKGFCSVLKPNEPIRIVTSRPILV